MPSKRNTREKHTINEERQNELNWAHNTKKPSDLKKNYVLPVIQTSRSPRLRNSGFNTITSGTEARKKQREDLLHKARNCGLNGSVLIGQGSSLVTTGGEMQKHLSNNLEHKLLVKEKFMTQKKQQEDLTEHVQTQKRCNKREPTGPNNRFDNMLAAKMDNFKGLF